MDTNRILRNLKIVYWGCLLGMFCVALMIEYIFIDGSGGIIDAPNIEFAYQSLVILLTMGALFLALRLFRIKSVEQLIKENPLTEYYPKSIVRMTILEFATMGNLIGYMLFVNSSFVWLALISVMGFFFIYPSKERFINETGYIEE